MNQNTLGIVVVVVIVIGSLAIGFGPELLRERKREALLREGSDATATIVRLVETGNLDNDRPEVRVTLVVQPAEGAAYQAEVVLILSPVDLVGYQIGAEVPVKYDPSNPSDVALAGVPGPVPAKVP